MLLSHDGGVHALLDHVHEVAATGNQVVQLADIYCFAHFFSVKSCCREPFAKSRCKVITFVANPPRAITLNKQILS